jgi:hypothetical protein
MAIATYVLETGSTWDAVAITSGTDFSWGESCSPTRLVADGSRSVGSIVVDQKMATITVNGLDASLLSNAKFRTGTTGSLVLKGKLRGNGSTTSTVKTFTFAEAVLISNNTTTPHDTNGTISITFEAYDSDDSNTVVAYT